jgi:ubiquinone biosynthesis protein COQ9
MTARRAEKDALLAAILPEVPFEGWSLGALRAAARSAGVEEAEARALFPRGGADMVACFSEWADRRMLEAVAALPLGSMKVRDRIAAVVMARLDSLAPHREAARAAASVLALPQNGALGLRLLYRTVDAAWYAAGDTSTDWNFYTKRGLLAAVYAATQLYWLEDRSAGAEDTRGFLERRLSDVMAIPRVTSRLGRLVDLVPNPFRLLNAARRR